MRGLIENPEDPTWKNEAYAEFVKNNVMVRKDQWKYNRYPKDRNQLFDLESDPGERINLLDNPHYAPVVDYFEKRIVNKFGRRVDLA